ncbi:uncharacterized protein BDR25DRAFT_316308 [Lindgomyces ingoldianus]|uniref:Uncharacterized protein n=1 Tax=Lindgomyces ingoldianus TaxID=673940 RepID=A0ACB6QMR0_9PLEO|nr:uncharacterized protein BDR25DRAFT_316308 [Lindgomyces ingoldianus]KAF2468180.1 hypothetical protein BDR25DRAFT_316308 [Lindgomyces ingoldianus]
MVNRPDRPGGLEFRSNSFDPLRSASNLSLGDLPSPKAGEVPPALSPLDALALQGRLLAKRFEQENKAGRRMSRLAPLTIQNEFGNRSGYFSSLTNSTVNSPSDELAPRSPRQQHSPQAQEHVSQDRHKSFYPQFGGDEPHYEHPLPYRNHLSPIGEARLTNTPPQQDYFPFPRTQSPEPVEPRIGLQEATPISPHMPRSNSGPRPFLVGQRKQSLDSLSVRQAGLAPPRSPGSLRSPKISPSIRAVPEDSSDEVENMSLGGSYDSLQARNLSPSSSLSRSHSPFTPLSNSSIPRSPSLSSEYSAGGSQLPRPAFNFSRPMSSASRPSLDVRSCTDGPSRQASDESAFMRPSFDSLPRRQDSGDSPITNYTNDLVHTPVSMTSEDFRRSTDYSINQAPTYTYSKFSLPRGRTLDRQSIGIEDFLNSQISWDQPKQGNGQAKSARPSSPPSPPHSMDQPRTQPEQTPTRSTSMERGAPSLTSSNSTIRARPSGSAEVTAQEHCDKGIEFHEAGEFTKSTYHLRLAARAGLAEGMFWYGLACRHGWGMRENKAEGMQWLRRAVDSGQLEVADDEDQKKHGNPTDLAKRNRHRAQYAVAIYELGKCYMNGWGAAQEKSLALRCYEIAGNWGDADALAETGYCYAEGVGCKKDMKKAAKFYRAAEAKGISMIGNSWIYKDKYMDDGSTVSDSRSVRSGRSVKKDPSEKKPRDKSRTRTIFGRKKSTT